MINAKLSQPTCEILKLLDNVWQYNSSLKFLNQRRELTETDCLSKMIGII